MTNIPVGDLVALLRDRELQARAEDLAVFTQEVLTTVMMALHHAELIDAPEAAKHVHERMQELQGQELATPYAVLLAEVFQGRMQEVVATLAPHVKP
ncbi:hypothetical protein ACFSB1_00925 [Halopseudomonas phragmitis]|uniref:Uncharacterized protein n=1 Tax=Halopseudomonas phragmitis TaxID=1931241 RepID=A0A1V0B6M1_9GAMM|nr:hypothetical protein [Halopseudomonas phragmitis]AQZ95541.1 hypothetical protein BVH74_12620 [Halopseudomonas phragmitis]